MVFCLKFGIKLCGKFATEKKDGKKIRVSPRQETCMPRPHSPCHGSRLSRPPGEARKLLDITYVQGVYLLARPLGNSDT